MTPYELDQIAAKARQGELGEISGIFEMLVALVQHAADKEAEHQAGLKSQEQYQHEVTRSL